MGAVFGMRRVDAKPFVMSSKEYILLTFSCLITKLNQFERSFTWFMCDFYMYAAKADIVSTGAPARDMAKYCKDVRFNCNSFESLKSQKDAGVSVVTKVDVSSAPLTIKKVKYTADQDDPVASSSNVFVAKESAAMKTTDVFTGVKFPSKINENAFTISDIMGSQKVHFDREYISTIPLCTLLSPATYLTHRFYSQQITQLEQSYTHPF
jgi:hypothetical protein